MDIIQNVPQLFFAFILDEQGTPINWLTACDLFCI